MDQVREGTVGDVSQELKLVVMAIPQSVLGISTLRNGLSLEPGSSRETEFRKGEREQAKVSQNLALQKTREGRGLVCTM
jgi:hypothetical protein